MNRRRGIFLALCVVGLLFPCENAFGGTLWYRQPARQWEEALPLGNGRLGAMVFGTPAGERLALNEESLWAGELTDHEAVYSPDIDTRTGSIEEIEFVPGNHPKWYPAGPEMRL